jgi:Icc-related predicted phosphoesterase
MKLVLISDTHERHRKLQHPIPDGDILIHAGDFTNDGDALWHGYLKEFNTWLGELRPRFQEILVVAGNHDASFEKEAEHSRKELTNCIYLENSGVKINGVKFYGSPVTPMHANMAFNRMRGDMIRPYWEAIPRDTSVLITHGPAAGVLDRWHPEAPGCGCEDLAAELSKLPKLKLHVFGHAHAGYGVRVVDGSYRVNAALCNVAGIPVNAPIVVEI